MSGVALGILLKTLWRSGDIAFDSRVEALRYLASLEKKRG
jgi:hypothetical protein